MEVISHFIDGDKFSHSGSTIDVYNPATGEPIRQVEMGTSETVNQAIESAKRAYPAWSKTPPLKRARIMFAFKDLLEANQDQIARLISEEHGKTIEDSRRTAAWYRECGIRLWCTRVIKRRIHPRNRTGH